MEGNVEFEIGEKNQNLKSGDFVIVPPGTLHRAFVLDASLPYKRFVFWISSSSKGLQGHTVARNCQDIKELLDYLGVEDAVMLGWSMS